MATANGSRHAEPEVLDGDVIPMIEHASRSVLARTMRSDAPRQALVPAAAPTIAVTPQVQARELVARLSVIREAMTSAMTLGVDYGIVPGTDKPTLFKPGAEKLGVLFQLDIQIVHDKTWGPGDHLTVESHATVFHAPSGTRLGYGEGMCTTREKKYAKRHAERSCPHCSATAVIKGKADYGGGWLCWRKRGGCGATFADNDQAITRQNAGEIDNPDLPDTWNTIVKMGAKRARVDAVLAVTGASAIFTQDAEDDPPPVPDSYGSSPQAQGRAPAAAVVPESERQARAEALACAQEILRRGIWDERRLNAEMLICKAADTSSVENGITSIPFDQLQALHSRMVNQLPAEPTT